MKLLHKKQKGVILVFSMVMLVLLTLISVNMIQQNKQGLTMMANARQKIQAFTAVEAALLAAERQIDLRRYQDEDAYKANLCISTNGETDNAQLDEGDVLIQVADTKATSTVTGVYCLAAIGGNESRCTYSSGGRDDNNPACIMLRNTGRLNVDQIPLPPPELPGVLIGCQVEIYEITTQIEEENNWVSGQSIIESKYAVNCSSNFNLD